MGAGRTLPLPPLALRERVGATTFPDSPVHERQVRRADWWRPDPAESWLCQGAFLVDVLRNQLPAGVTFSGARVLDFGCGAGRVLRHLVDEVGEGELHGVDIDRPSIEWLQANASPPLNVATCDERPGLPYPDDHFDVVYALSVFTHIVADWTGWLLELRRVLSPDGVLLATVIGRRDGGRARPRPDRARGPGDARSRARQRMGQRRPDHGPRPYWVAERWGRAFEIVSHAPRVTGEPWPHDVVVARPPPAPRCQDDLLATGADGAAGGRARSGQLRTRARRRALGRSSRNDALVARSTRPPGWRGLEARASSGSRSSPRRYGELKRERAAIALRASARHEARSGPHGASRDSLRWRGRR